MIAPTEEDREEGDNEVKRCLYMPTVGATEAFWRLYEFKLHTRFPSVYNLDIHLEDPQDMYFEDNTVIKKS